MDACLHVCVSNVCMPRASGGQKRALDHLDIKLQTVVRYQGMLGIEPGSSAEGPSAFNQELSLQSHREFFFFEIRFHTI